MSDSEGDCPLSTIRCPYSIFNCAFVVSVYTGKPDRLRDRTVFIGIVTALVGREPCFYTNSEVECLWFQNHPYILFNMCVYM